MGCTVCKVRTCAVGAKRSKHLRAAIHQEASVHEGFAIRQECLAVDALLEDCSLVFSVADEVNGLGRLAECRFHLKRHGAGEHGQEYVFFHNSGLLRAA